MSDKAEKIEFFHRDVKDCKKLFIDTAPIIYYIEANPSYGEIAREAINLFREGQVKAYTSIVTLVEVLPLPIKSGDTALSEKYSKFLSQSKGLDLIEINRAIGESAGNLRGRYNLNSMDAIQIASALYVGADFFLSNDAQLQRIKEMKVLMLKDYIPTVT
jgi:predicted nucleic acid-binding protein